MTVIGRVEYIADIDGKKLPAAARKIGRSAGGEMGKAASKAYNSEFDDALTKYAQKFTSRMRSAGTLSGKSFSDSMRRIVNSGLDELVDEMADVFGKKGGIEAFTERMGGAGEATDKLRANIERLNSEGRVTSAQYKMLIGQIDTYSAGVMDLRRNTSEASLAQSEFDLTAAKLGRTLDDLANEKMANLNAAAMDNIAFNQALDAEYQKLIQTHEARQRALDDEDDALIRAHESSERMRTSSDKMTRSLDGQSSGWKNLSANTRQWILIGTAIAASAEEISVLGSAAGSSLTVLAGAFGATAIAGGVAIAAFQGMNSEISELDAAVQPAAIALQGFVEQFSILQDAIQLAAMDQAAAAFDSMRVTVEALTPAFVAVGESVGKVIDTFAASIAPGTQGFANLLLLIEKSGPVFETLASAAIIFGEALGNVFVLSIPFVEIFASWLVQIAEQFRTFTIDNADAITEWFQNGLTIMQALGPLVGAVGDALASLVTPETVAMTVEFIQGLTEFMPILAGILSVIGELDLLNIFVELLLAIGHAIEPLLPALGQMAAALSDTLMSAIAMLAPVLLSLMQAIEPLLPIITQVAGALIIAAMEAFLPLADVIIAQLIPALIPLFEALIPLLPVIIQLATVIGAALAQAMIALMPILIPLIDLFLVLIQALEPILPVITGIIQMAIGPLIAIVQIASGVIGALIGIVVGIIKPFVDMGREMSNEIDLFGQINDVIQGSIGFWEDWGAAVGGVIEGVIGWVEDALGVFMDLFDASAKAPSPGGGSSSGGGGGGGGFAAGGIAAYAARRLTGEAGREAIVPLQRPLAAVDPSVRTLAAFAQGKLGQMGMGGGGKSVTFAEGAIIVQTVSPDGRLIAEAVVDRIAADADI